MLIVEICSEGIVVSDSKVEEYVEHLKLPAENEKITLKVGSEILVTAIRARLGKEKYPHDLVEIHCGDQVATLNHFYEQSRWFDEQRVEQKLLRRILNFKKSKSKNQSLKN